MLSKSIERAQRKVEENNFGIRKRLLEYDDVMNSQRGYLQQKEECPLRREDRGRPYEHDFRLRRNYGAEEG